MRLDVKALIPEILLLLVMGGLMVLTPFARTNDAGTVPPAIEPLPKTAGSPAKLDRQSTVGNNVANFPGQAEAGGTNLPQVATEQSKPSAPLR